MKRKALRTRMFPGIAFRGEDWGRRPWVIGTAFDVWRSPRTVGRSPSWRLFPDIARRWAEAARPHAGLAIVVGIDHGEFGTIPRALERLFEERSDRRDWCDYTCFASRRSEP